MMNWTSCYENKKIVILGFGKEGQSTFHFLKSYVKNCQLQIMDINYEYVASQIDESDKETFLYKEGSYLKFHKDVDLIFKSPGIPLKQLEGCVELSKITSQSNEFIKEYRDQIIGVTGTKGKSTVCTFVAQLLRDAGEAVELIGNIGRPPFEAINFDLEDRPTYVYELSSHQLETVKASPATSVILNIFEEHLDHYHSFEHYAEAKMNIARYQKQGDTLIYSRLDEEIIHRLEDYEGHLYPITLLIEDDLGDNIDRDQISEIGDGIEVGKEKIRITFDGKSIDIAQSDEVELKGIFNLMNMSVGYLIYRIYGHSDYFIVNELIKSFKGLSHRLAKVKKINGVTYYNDSISTIPQASIAAVNALSNVDTLILGGMDRGIQYQPLIEFINQQEKLKCILMPETGHKIYDHLMNKERLFKVNNLEEAVRIASSITLAGKSCLLSPAASSYGFFKNFEDRGNQFEALVEALSVDV